LNNGRRLAGGCLAGLPEVLDISRKVSMLPGAGKTRIKGEVLTYQVFSGVFSIIVEPVLSVWAVRMRVKTNIGA
jgi:hypothetical protein